MFTPKNLLYVGGWAGTTISYPPLGGADGCAQATISRPGTTIHRGFQDGGQTRQVGGQQHGVFPVWYAGKVPPFNSLLPRDNQSCPENGKFLCFRFSEVVFAVLPLSALIAQVPACTCTSSSHHSSPGYFSLILWDEATFIFLARTEVCFAIFGARNFFQRLLEMLQLCYKSAKRCTLCTRRSTILRSWRKTTPLDILLWELCQNPIVLERENIKMLTEDILSFRNSLVRLDFDKVLTVKC